MQIPRVLIEDGYITERKHPDCNYFIYNYTAKTQYEGFWNEWTMQCRGLILDDRGNIIAKPFPKFFNIQEYCDSSPLGTLPIKSDEKFELFEKIDGSLGIQYQMPDGEWRIATRGSFESEQAKVATEILHRRYVPGGFFEFRNGYTYLWEIIYPENRIVIDYGSIIDIVLLGVVNNLTGKEWDYDFTLCNFCGGTTRIDAIPLVRKYGEFTLNEIPKIDEHNKEGFVLKTKNDFRVKLKFDEYRRLHKLITGVSTKTIWELLKDEKPIGDLLDRVPDEFYKWVKSVAQRLFTEYTSIAIFCKVYLSNIPDLTNAKECGILSDVAKKISQHEYSSVLFAMWKNKPYKKIIWKLLKPKYEKPFKEVV